MGHLQMNVVPQIMSAVRVIGSTDVDRPEESTAAEERGGAWADGWGDAVGIDAEGCGKVVEHLRLGFRRYIYVNKKTGSARFMMGGRGRRGS